MDEAAFSAWCGRAARGDDRRGGRGHHRRVRRRARCSAPAGIVPPPAGYWEAISPILRAHDILLDRRRGRHRLRPAGLDVRLRAHYDLAPDLITIAKGLTSAYAPLSGSIVSDRMYEVLMEGTDRFGPIGHGWTYSAHPVCAAAGVANLELVDELGLVANAAAMGRRLLGGLRAALDGHPNVAEVRGEGLLCAVELAADPQCRERRSIRAAKVAAGVVARMLGDGGGDRPRDARGRHHRARAAAVHRRRRDRCRRRERGTIARSGAVTSTGSRRDTDARSGPGRRNAAGGAGASTAGSLGEPGVVSLGAVERARERIREVVRPTPVRASPLARCGARRAGAPEARAPTDHRQPPPRARSRPATSRAPTPRGPASWVPHAGRPAAPRPPPGASDRARGRLGARSGPAPRRWPHGRPASWASASRPSPIARPRCARRTSSSRRPRRANR